jgi:basic membrane protein A
MKKLLSVLLIAAMLLSITACAGGETAKAEYKAALLLNGNLGDKSFYDSANDGLTKLKTELKGKFDFKVVEMGATPADESKWSPTLMNYCDSKEYNVIIIGTWQMAGALAEAAAKYPDQKFIFFDERFDFDTFNAGFEAGKEPKNIYNVLYKQNEVSFLVGAAAAMMTTDSNMSMVDPSNKKIGFLGGMENAVIQDFLLGYIQGAKHIDASTEIAIAYVGNFYDSAAGKDLALTQYNSGVDVGYNVAGGAGLGQIEAAAEANKWAFGVDSDQAALLPNMAKNIPTSALKNVGNSLIMAIKKDMENKLTYGIAESMGFAEGGVELVKDAHYKEMLSESIRTRLEELEKDITDGKIVVDTTFGKTDAEIKALIDKAQ